jgi:AcrR family transcriptional regulator
MTGLRERQKADRSRRILEAALRLFRDLGYGAVRIEDIAEAAEVSVGTCYNYFLTKGDILLAIVSMEVEEVVEAGRAVIADPPQEVAEALDRLIRIYYDHSLYYLSKELWRIAMALTIEAPDTPFSQRYSQLDAMLAQQVGQLVTALQERGLMRRDLRPEVLAQVVFNTLNQLFTEFVRQEDMPIADLHHKSRAMTDMLAGLIAVKGPAG